MDAALRPMRWRDLERVVALEQELFAGDPPWTAEQFWSELAGVPTTRWYVVAEDTSGHLVGYAGLMASDLVGEPADVQTIAVAAHAQRQGVGASLMAGLVTEAIRRRAGSLMLDVRADNASALAFYARRGFERVGLRRGYYQGGRDGIVMRRRLSSEASG